MERYPNVSDVYLCDFLPARAAVKQRFWVDIEIESPVWGHCQFPQRNLWGANAYEDVSVCGCIQPDFFAGRIVGIL